MDRRRFLQGMATTAAVGLAAGRPGRAGTPDATATRAAPPPIRIPSAQAQLAGKQAIARFSQSGQDWQVLEDFSHPDGALALVCGDQACVLAKRTEAAYSEASTPYFGMRQADIALAGADLLADHLLSHGEPDEAQVRLAAPPVASQLNPADYYGRLPWTSFVGTRQCSDTMPVYTAGSTRTYHAEQVFAELHDAEKVARRREGLLGGWLPAVHKVVPLDDGRWYDVLVFADVDADDRFVVQTWHRTALVEHGRISRVVYGHSYPSYPPRREPPAAADFYAALLRFHDAWQAELAGAAATSLPVAGWDDMPRFAFARELVVRPGGSYPKYGAVDRDYYGNEYDGFQDTFTSSLYANLEWGRFEQAAAVLDEYFTDFVYADGLINMRGPETGQYGLTLSLLARYLHYTGDRALLLKHREKIQATATLLVQLHDESLKLPDTAPGHGLIHGWNESDSCLFPDPSLWWKPYYANSAMAARGLADLAAVWPSLQPGAGAQAADWQRRARMLRTQTEHTLRANVRHDLSPPYVGPLPGVSLTFRESLAHEHPSEQQWPHRAYAELLQADVLPDELANLVIDCMRGHGATSIGVVANIGPVDPHARDILGFISYGYAQQLLRLDRIDEYLLFLYAHRHHVHTPGGWTAGEVTGLDGSMPLFCMPAQMTIPLLLRWMLVSEDSAGDTLYLGRAIPHAWLHSGTSIACSALPTRWGKTGFALQLQADRHHLHGHVDMPPDAPDNAWLSLRLPPGRQWREVRADGRVLEAHPRGDRFRLPRHATGRLTIEAALA
ncbi:Tat pathway signal protein [Dyella sp. A6]|uniref:Tat pathway signal protein n=1 Tax=Dyella aluminiiresistens TaxID=3069105 RepID=UPI002E76C6CB|nr:Tat pathway signal protein [Dyella sp. A6]